MFRNLPYFSRTSNLDKLRNIITTYVWENLDEGYMQVMDHNNSVERRLHAGNGPQQCSRAEGYMQVMDHNNAVEGRATCR